MEKMSIQKIQKDLNYIWKEWNVKEFIGEGSFGKVYRIERRDTFGQTYQAALKVITISGKQAKDPSVIDEIVKEFSLMARVKGNSNIVSYEDHAILPQKNGKGWRIYIRMELLMPFKEYQKKEDFSVKKVIRLGIDLCRALEVCEQYEIIHRDIKPENIFVSELGNFKLGDFGIARQMRVFQSNDVKKGTYTYMAPEIIQGKEYDRTVDLYSLGLVLYRCLDQGRLPFYPSYPEKISPQEKKEAQQRRLLGEEISVPLKGGEKLGHVIRKACAYDVSKRYQDPARMRQDLEAILEECVDESLKDNFQCEKKQFFTEEKKESEETISLFQEEPQNLEDEDTYKLNLGQGAEKRAKVSSSLKGIWLALMVCILCGSTAVYVWSCQRKVPSFYRMTIAEAKEKAKRHDLKIKIRKRKFSSQAEYGEILTQDKKAGSKVRKGSVIEVVVSKGYLYDSELWYDVN